MTSRIVHRASDTFTQACQAFVDLDMASPRDLTNVRVAAVMVAPLRDPVELDVDVYSPTTGEFILKLDEEYTKDWRPTAWTCRITYEENGDRASTEAFQIEVVADWDRRP